MIANYRHYTTETINKHKDKEVLVVRTTDLWHDLKALDEWLGGTVVAEKFASSPLHTTCRASVLLCLDFWHCTCTPFMWNGKQMQLLHLTVFVSCNWLHCELDFVTLNCCHN